MGMKLRGVLCAGNYHNPQRNISRLLSLVPFLYPTVVRSRWGKRAMNFFENMGHETEGRLVWRNYNNSQRDIPFLRLILVSFLWGVAVLDEPFATSVVSFCFVQSSLPQVLTHTVYRSLFLGLPRLLLPCTSFSISIASPPIWSSSLLSRCPCHLSLPYCTFFDI